MGYHDEFPERRSFEWAERIRRVHHGISQVEDTIKVHPASKELIRRVTFRSST